MLRTVRIENFKSLAKVELELGRFNMFIGANGSGKSNLLEALGILGAAAYGVVDDESLLRRGVRPGVPQLYKSAFPHTSRAQHITFEGEDESGASYRVTLWNPAGDPSPAWKFKHETLIDADGAELVTRGPRTKEAPNQAKGLAASKMAEIEPSNPAVQLMERLGRFAIYAPNTPTLRQLIPDPQAREPIGLSGGRLPESVLGLISILSKGENYSGLGHGIIELIDWISGFGVSTASSVPLSPSAARSPLVVQFTDRFMASRRNKLSGYDASEGALYVLFYAVLALHPRVPEILAVDNFDQALNPRLVKRLTTAVCDWTNAVEPKRQWLLTGHNPAALDGLPLNQPDVCLFAVDRDSNGHTCVNRIDLAEAQKRRPDNSWTLSRMWMNGYLGAVPNV